MGSFVDLGPGGCIEPPRGALVTPLAAGARKVTRIAALGLFFLLISGCDGGSSSHTQVAGTSTVPGIVLEGVFLHSLDAGGPFGRKTCTVSGTVRNDTPDKILEAMVLTAVDSEGTVIAMARVDSFGVTRLPPPTPTVRPGESAPFSGVLLGLNTCSEIARIVLTEAILR